MSLPDLIRQSIEIAVSLFDGPSGRAEGDNGEETSVCNPLIARASFSDSHLVTTSPSDPGCGKSPVVAGMGYWSALFVRPDEFPVGHGPFQGFGPVSAHQIASVTFDSSKAPATVLLTIISKKH